MKSRFALLIFAGLFAYLVLESNAGGYSRNETGARGQTGCSCHNSTSSLNPIVELDSAGVPVLSYVPGMSYTVTMSAAQQTGKAYFGFELSLVKLTGAGTTSAATAGTWGTLPSGCRTGTVMIEQSQALAASNNMYKISIPWTAPAAGTGSVKIYGILNAVNGNGNESGDGAQNATNNGLTISEAVSCPAATVTATDSLLTASAAGATAYQWYNGATLIQGATSATYIATATGSYSVAITAGSCNVTSNTVAYTAPANGINDVTLANNIKVYPTLTSDLVRIQTASIGDLKYELYDLNGSLHMSGSLTENTVNTIDLRSLGSAVYIVRISNENSSATYKIVKQ